MDMIADIRQCLQPGPFEPFFIVTSSRNRYRVATADHAGIKVGDVAVSMNGVSLESAAQLRNALGLLRVGQSVEMHVLRNGAERSVTLILNSPSSLSQP